MCVNGVVGIITSSK